MNTLRRAALLCLACCTLLLRAQTGGKITFSPQWTAQSQFAGYYAAYELGFYAAEGLDVQIKHPSASDPAIHLLTQGKSQLISLQLIQAMGAKDRGVPLRNVLQTSQNSGFCIVSRRKIRKLQELQDAKVGRWLAGFGELGEIIRAEYGLRWTWIPFVSSIELFISGAIDASLAMDYSEYLQMTYSGLRLGRGHCFSAAELGFNIPDDGLYVSEDYYRAHPDAVRRFARATRKGWEWAAEHPEEALGYVMKWMAQEQVPVNYTIQRQMLDRVLRQQTDSRSGKRPFSLDKAQFEQANRLLLKHRFISHPVAYDQFTTR